jgi:hypothetical protein
MIGQRVKTAWSVILVGTLLALPASAEASHKTISDSFQVTAAPLPSPSIYGVDGLCWDQGIEGIHKVSHRFVPPFDGFLIGEIETAAGTWYLAVDDPADPGPYNSLGGATDKTLPIPLHAGQEVDLVACNSAGAPTADVSYEFTHASIASPPRGPKKKYTWTEEFPYDSPSVGTVYPIRHEAECLFGCPAVGVEPSDRFVTVEIEDRLSPEVSAMTYQWSEVTGRYEEDYFCTSTVEPIELIPYASGVGVGIALGPCEDGTPAMASIGTITLTLSNRR